MKNIILVGMMSSGKTTVGKKLALRLGYTFIDLDRLIVEDQGMEITELFSLHGEEHFRRVETRILNSLKPNHQLVVASGGGTPCFNTNMATIAALGLSVYLDLPATVLAERIRRHNKDDRPILSGALSLEDTLRQKIKEREHFYQMADHTISGEHTTAALVEDIANFLKQTT